MNVIFRRILSAAPFLLLCNGGATDVVAQKSNKEHDWKNLRMKMVEFQIKDRGIKSPAVIKALRTVPRHELVPIIYRLSAYEDRPAHRRESDDFPALYRRSDVRIVAGKTR